MILSDRDLRAEIEAGRLVVEPFDETALQPSSIDLRVGNHFRVFANHRYPHIDVRKPLEDLTELVEATEDEPFMLHPGEFVLGSTLETVTLPNNLVARLEGKSSLGRLGLLIHSSLPGDEPVLFLRNGCLTQLRIEDIVRKQLDGSVVSFDPESFRISYHEVTGWHESSPDKIFEVVLSSRRRVHLTGGHALFSLDRNGEIAKVRVHELVDGMRVAIAGTIPPPPSEGTRLDLIVLAPEAAHPRLVCGGPTVAAAFAKDAGQIATSLREAGIYHTEYYAQRARLPLAVALQYPEVAAGLDAGDWLAVQGGRHKLPAVVEVREELAWLFGLYVAEGYRRSGQITISNTDQSILDRAQSVLASLGLSVYRAAGAITCCSGVLSSLIEWLGIGSRAREKRIPYSLLGWPDRLLDSFLEGFVDGDGSREATRLSLWSSSEELVGDLLLVCARLGRRAAASVRHRGGRSLWQVSIPHREHKLLNAIPNCDRLLIDARIQAGVTQKEAAAAAGFRHSTQLNNLERRRSEGVRPSTLRSLRKAYTGAPAGSLRKLDRLVEGDLRWDTVAHVRDTGRIEPVFDLEVRPAGRRIENFLAGRGGVLVSNTAGFVDAGFSGQLTLELSNVANLPISIYPGMRVGQLCLFQMSSPAEKPYGSADMGSKYQEQRGPTPSRYFENFERR